MDMHEQNYVDRLESANAELRVEVERLRGILEEIKEESSTCGFCDSAVIASKGKGKE
jgi:hypothetical protein